MNFFENFIKQQQHKTNNIARTELTVGCVRETTAPLMNRHFLQ